MSVDVKSLAELARLALSEEELTRLAPELDAILTYAARLDALDTASVDATRHAVPLSAPFREDRVSSTLDRNQALANAPAHDGETFIVPKVV